MKYDELQSHTLSQAKLLASQGEEFSHLIKILSPNNSLLLKIFVQSLPESTRLKTIYGKAVSKQIPVTKKKK